MFKVKKAGCRAGQPSYSRDTGEKRKGGKGAVTINQSLTPGWTWVTNEGFREIDLKNVRSLGFRNSTRASEEAGKRDWFRSHAELGRYKVKQKF